VAVSRRVQVERKQERKQRKRPGMFRRRGCGTDIKEITALFADRNYIWEILNKESVKLNNDRPT